MHTNHRAVLAACVLAGSLATAIPAHAGTNLSWQLSSFPGEGGDYVVISTVTTADRQFVGTITVRNGEIVDGQRYSIPPSGGTQTKEIHVPLGATYTAILARYNGTVIGQTTIDGNCVS